MQFMVDSAYIETLTGFFVILNNNQRVANIFIYLTSLSFAYGKQILTKKIILLNSLD